MCRLFLKQTRAINNRIRRVHIELINNTKWLTHYATDRKVAGSISDEVIFKNLPNPSGRNRPWGLLSL
jgi:hypothetical protein